MIHHLVGKMLSVKVSLGALPDFVRDYVIQSHYYKKRMFINEHTITIFGELVSIKQDPCDNFGWPPMKTRHRCFEMLGLFKPKVTKNNLRCSGYNLEQVSCNTRLLHNSISNMVSVLSLLYSFRNVRV